MPTYEFICPDGHKEERTMAYGDVVTFLCPTCGKEMRKRFVMPGVNWGGLKPSQGEIRRDIKQHIEDAPANREKHLQSKEQGNG